MRQWMVIFLFALVVSGCGSKWAYENSDWFAAHYIGQYIDLDDSQRSFVRQTLRMSIPWHRNNELPAYVSHIDQIGVIDPKTFTVAQLRKQQDQIQQHTLRLYQHFSPQIVTLVSRLDDEQAEQFLDYLRVKHVQRKRRYQDHDEQQFRQRFKSKMTNTLEEWMGPLNQQQQVLVADWAQERNVTLPLWFEYQTHLRIEVKELLKRRTNKELVKTELDSFVYQPQQFYTPELASLVEQNTLIGEKYLVAIINQMSDTQNRHLEEELDYWRELMQDLRW